MRLVPAVLRGCQTLDLLLEAGAPLKVSTIARTLGIPRNTMYELVRTLEACHLIQFSADGTIWLGSHLFELGSAYAQSLDLVREARLIALKLTKVCNETTHVAVLEDRDVVYIVKEESEQMVRLVSAVGRRVPAHGTAIGKIQLAFLTDDELQKLFDGVELEKMTPNTITTLDQLQKDLREARIRGYATDNQESSPDVCCVAAAIRDDSSQVIAGMSISVPVSRWSTSRQRELARLVSDAATSLSLQLGYSGASGQHSDNENDSSTRSRFALAKDGSLPAENSAQRVRTGGPS